MSVFSARMEVPSEKGFSYVWVTILMPSHLEQQKE